MMKISLTLKDTYFQLFVVVFVIFLPSLFFAMALLCCFFFHPVLLSCCWYFPAAVRRKSRGKSDFPVEGRRVVWCGKEEAAESKVFDLSLMLCHLLDRWNQATVVIWSGLRFIGYFWQGCQKVLLLYLHFVLFLSIMCSSTSSFTSAANLFILLLTYLFFN